MVVKSKTGFQQLMVEVKSEEPMLVDHMASVKLRVSGILVGEIFGRIGYQKGGDSDFYPYVILSYNKDDAISRAHGLDFDIVVRSQPVTTEGPAIVQILTDGEFVAQINGVVENKKGCDGKLYPCVTFTQIA